ncbi:MAG: class II aldolase [Alphaproteobacteria bacterium]|nr:MAG: class II aldolase [Alphaproteobacteria bacterium]
MKHLSLRHAIIETAQKMTALGLNQGTAGNVSVRADDTLLLTPSGVAYEDLTPGDIVSMTFDNRWSVENPGRYPTSEWRIHRDILSTHNEVGAVLHAHSPFCTTLACLQRDIPAFHYMIAVAGGDSIRCAPYATFGTEELSKAALAALEDRKACLLAQHGMIACGTDLTEALKLAVEVETLAQTYWRALQIGEPTVLSTQEMQRVLKKFAAGYGFGSEPDNEP